MQEVPFELGMHHVSALCRPTNDPSKHMKYPTFCCASTDRRRHICDGRVDSIRHVGRVYQIGVVTHRSLYVRDHDTLYSLVPLSPW